MICVCWVQISSNPALRKSLCANSTPCRALLHVSGKQVSVVADEVRRLFTFCFISIPHPPPEKGGTSGGERRTALSAAQTAFESILRELSLLPEEECQVNSNTSHSYYMLQYPERTVSATTLPPFLPTTLEHYHTNHYVPEETSSPTDIKLTRYAIHTCNDHGATQTCAIPDGKK